MKFKGDYTMETAEKHITCGLLSRLDRAGLNSSSLCLHVANFKYLNNRRGVPGGQMMELTA